MGGHEYFATDQFIELAFFSPAFLDDVSVDRVRHVRCSRSDTEHTTRRHKHTHSISNLPPYLWEVNLALYF